MDLFITSLIKAMNYLPVHCTVLDFYIAVVVF